MGRGSRMAARACTPSTTPALCGTCTSCQVAWGKACLLIRKHDHFTPTREIRRHVRALACNHPKVAGVRDEARASSSVGIS
jgi:hypothetical protein